MIRLAAVAMTLVLSTACVPMEPLPMGPMDLPRPPVARVWLTTADQKQMLAQQPDVLPSPGPAAATEVVTLDPSRTYQEVRGFGASMTDASAYLLSRLPDDKRHALMEELFGRRAHGLGLSTVRLTVGASDFSSEHYSYNDTPGNVPDPELRHFSIAPARQYVLPRMREALALNPELEVMISPWSAPAWMKTTGSLIKGKLKPEYYPAFANYLARTVEAFGAEGVPVTSLTIQNEPDFEPADYPGMRIDSPDRAIIIGQHVGPTFRRRGLQNQILDYDHNWDNPEMPTAVLSDPVANRFIAGVAWHCYEGDIAAQTPVHDRFPDKHVWMTECSGGNWSGTFADSFGWTVEKLIIGGLNHWSRGIMLWNLALDPAHGPHKGGCGDCRGVVTIDPASGSITRNPEYYALGHASRFVLPGAHRIGVTASDGVHATALANPDGSRVAILYRKSGSGAVAVSSDGNLYALDMPKGSVATLRWSGPRTP